MRFIDHKITIEEMIFSLVLAVFFAVIFLGAWQFSYDSAIFPIMLSSPALVLVTIYIFRGMFPPAFNAIIANNDKFSIGKKPEKLNKKTEKQNISYFKAYFVFAYTALYAGLAYLLGFYLAAVIAVFIYVYVVRKKVKYIIPVAIFLIIIISGLTYVFDTAFGYHYSQGALLKL